MKNFFLAAYLAIKEVIRNRGRFLMVALVIALITLLVLFIAALGEGLSNANRQYVANLDAQLIVFLEKSDFSITASRLETNTVKSVRRVEGVADAGPIYTSNTEIVSLEEPLKISMLGVEANRPGMPALLEGRYFRGGEAREAVMDKSVAERSNLKIGDEIRVRSTQGTEDQFYNLKIVGLVDKQAYFFQPTIFVPAATWELVRPQSESDLNSDTPFPNIIAVKLSDPSQIEQVKLRLLKEVTNIEVADIETTINNSRLHCATRNCSNAGIFYSFDWRACDWRLFPNSDIAEGSTDRCLEGDWLLQCRGWCFSRAPDHYRHGDRRGHWSLADFSLLPRPAIRDSARIQWHPFDFCNYFAAVDRSVGRACVHYLRSPH